MGYYYSQHRRQERQQELYRDRWYDRIWLQQREREQKYGVIHDDQRHGGSSRKLHELPLEVLQRIFVYSCNFALPLCNHTLRYCLTHSLQLQRDLLKFMALEVDGELALPIDVCQRKFVTRELLEYLEIKKFYFRKTKDHDEEQQQQQDAEDDERGELDRGGKGRTKRRRVMASRGSRRIAREREQEEEQQDIELLRRKVSQPVTIPECLERVPFNDRRLGLVVYLLTETNCVPYDSFTLIPNLIEQGEDAAVKWMVNEKKSPYDYTAIHQALQYENKQLAEFLLTDGFVDIEDEEMWTHVLETDDQAMYEFLQELGGAPPLKVLQRAMRR